MGEFGTVFRSFRGIMIPLAIICVNLELANNVFFPDASCRPADCSVENRFRHRSPGNDDCLLVKKFLQFGCNPFDAGQVVFCSKYYYN